MNKFIENKGYIKDENNLTELHLYEPVESDKTYNVLLIDTESTAKERLEAIGNLFSEFAQIFSLKDKDLSEDNIIMLRSIGRFLGYLLNCDQWDKNEYKEYDSNELKKRLEIIKNQIK